MPSPLTSFSTDQFVYDYVCNPLAKQLCFVDPNVISAMGFLLVIPIIHNILTNRSTVELVLLMVLKGIIDCLDGSVARNCNKCTKLGAVLDILFDTFSIVLISAAVILKLGQSTRISPAVKYVLIVLLVVTPSMCFYHLRTELSGDSTNRYTDQLDVLIHDNIIVTWIVFALIIKYMV